MEDYDKIHVEKREVVKRIEVVIIKADLEIDKKVEPYDLIDEAKRSDEEVLQKIDEVVKEVVESGTLAKEVVYLYSN